MTLLQPINYGRWKSDPSHISGKNSSTSRSVMGVRRSESKCKMQLHRFRAKLFTYLWVNNINVHFCNFCLFFEGFSKISLLWGKSWVRNLCNYFVLVSFLVVGCPWDHWECWNTVSLHVWASCMEFLPLCNRWHSNV